MTSDTPTQFYDGPGEMTGLAAWTYQSQALMDLEYERVILPSWQFACHINQVRTPGSYATLDLLRDSVAVVRGEDGHLRAFKNVCRHRGARLLDGNGVCKGVMVCPYHGWSYKLDGTLRATPARKTFPGLDLGRHGLDPVEVEVMHGLVFVRIVPGGPGLAEIWGEEAKLLAPYRLQALEPAADAIHTEVWPCNWKVAVDNNLENYHIPIGHPGYDRMLDNDLMGFMNAHGVAGSASRHKAELSGNWSERRYQQLAPATLEDLESETRRTWMFFTMPPNIGIDIYPDSMDVFQILPRTATTCTVRYPVFRPRDGRREARVLRYLNGRINRQVMREDRELCERVQAGLASHGYQPGPLSTLEVAIKDFHDRIRAVIPEAGLAEPPAHLDPRAGAMPMAAE
ncbi:MAG: aromatic ring-hydroxylating dioxygenase subunit alpha [Hyphomicrobiaceae bacterium]